MTRYRRPASAVRRIRNRLLPGAGAATALIVAWAMTTSGTLSLWQDRHIHLTDRSVSAGTAGLDVEGFLGLAFDYGTDALTTQATIDVINTGNVPLSGFEATRSTVSGNAEVTTAPTTSFTLMRPAGDGPSTDWDGWLEGLTLEPDEEVRYLVTTTLSQSDFERLALQDAVTKVTITATAGTGASAWDVSAEGTYTQAVAEPLAPGWDNENMTFTAAGHSHIVFTWDNPSHARPGTVYQVQANGISLSFSANYDSRHISVGPSQLPSSLLPSVGQTWSLEFTVTMDGAIIARGTAWVTGITQWEFMFSTTAPQSAAPKLALSTPVAPQRAAAPAPAPAAPAPEPAPAAAAQSAPQSAPETPTVNPSQLPPPQEPVDPPVGAPMTVESSTVVLTWADAPPDATKFTLEVGGEQIEVTPLNGSFTADIPTKLWNEDGTDTELTFTIVATMPDGSEVKGEAAVTMMPPGWETDAGTSISDDE